MQLDYLDIVKKIVLKNIPQNEFAVFLFGSRAAGNANSLSDIDIGFLGTDPLPISILVNLESDLEESIVPFKIDLIDFYQVDKDFKNEALSNVQIWNCPKNIKLN
ncbi:nucleotidyltransferase domain-containing protein [Daejeonella sp.]|uniref:nucleotidyltransferase domain-containing protein n=1 Tax=Daejeonella sp. TaxID=2805397 RepID=UPI0025BE5137|nr:nucleotidyltransferase domain-containing protein [Daejeonella sp.]